MADMTDAHDLKRYDFLDYMSRTTEYSFLSDKNKNIDQSETEATMARFFTTEYVTDFVGKVLSGSFLSTVRSELEEVETQQVEEVEVEVEEGEVEQVSGHSTGNSSPKIKHGTAHTQTQGQGQGQGPVVRAVGSNFNAR